MSQIIPFPRRRVATLTTRRPALPFRAGAAGLALAVVALLVACAGYSPDGLKSGATVADAERSMGPRTGTYPRPDNGQRLEFARGPAGKHTYMLDFDAQGRLVQATQALTERQFAQVVPGDTVAQVLARIGHPSEVTTVGRPGHYQSVWSYRYDAAFCLWFQVSLDLDGRVLEGTYAPDPLCDPKD
jgi:hypothetical protein